MRIVNMFTLVALLAIAACGEAVPSADVVDSGAAVTPAETPQDDAGSVVSSDAGVEPTSVD